MKIRIMNQSLKKTFITAVPIAMTSPMVTGNNILALILDQLQSKENLAKA